MAQRVVVTGWGVVSRPIGHTAERLFWANLVAGRLRNRRADRSFRPTSWPKRSSPRSRITIRSKHFDERAAGAARPRRAVRRDRGARGDGAVRPDIRRRAVRADRDHHRHRGRRPDHPGRRTTSGSTATTPSGCIRSPFPKLMVNAPASQVSMHCGLRGPAFVVASACASATHAIGLAFQHGALRRGDVRGDRRRRGLHHVRHHEGLGGDARAWRPTPAGRSRATARAW